MIQPRTLLPPYYDGNALRHTGAKFRGPERCANVEEPGPGPWEDVHLHSVFRDSNMPDGVLPYVTLPLPSLRPD